MLLGMPNYYVLKWAKLEFFSLLQPEAEHPGPNYELVPAKLIR